MREASALKDKTSVRTLLKTVSWSDFVLFAQGKTPFSPAARATTVWVGYPVEKPASLVEGLYRVL